MSRLSTILLLLTAVGLAVFVGVTHRWRFSTDRVVQPGTALFQFDPAEITGISIKNGDQSFRIQRSGDEWRLTKGLEDLAAPEAVNALIQTALQTPVLDRIDATEIRDEKNLSGFGVLKSSLQIDFKGDKPPSLLIGKSGPDGSRNYVSFENSKTVYLIPSDLVRLISLPMEKYRDRRILPIDPGQIDRIVFRKANSTLELQRDAGGWKILRPLVAPADATAVEDLLSKARELRLEDIQSGHHTESSAETRLDTFAEARFFIAGEETPHTIHLSTPSRDVPLAARLEPRNITGTVPEATWSLLTPDMKMLRDPALFLINLDMVDVIRVENGDTRKDITRTREGWSDTSDAIRDIAKTFAETKVARRLPATPTELEKCGLTPPRKRIVFLATLSENTPEAMAGQQFVGAVAIGMPLPDGDLPVHVEGTPEIALVPASLLDFLP